jgi:large subunit ribosomal protein L1
MGKKRVAVIGDVFDEEITRKKRVIQREQKKIRGGEKIEAEKQTRADELKKIEELKDLTSKKGHEEKAKSAKVSGMKGGERVIDTTAESMAELERLKKKELELEKLAAEAAGQTLVKPKKVRTRSSRYLNAKKAGEQVGYQYSIAEAVPHLRKVNLTKFPATLELHLNLIKQDVFSNQVVELPHGIGKTKKVEVVSDGLLKKLEKGVADFDVLLARPKDMANLVKYAKLLGPKGLMPNPKTGTIVDDPQKMKDKFGADNRIELKIEKKAPLIHTVAGKLSMKDEQLENNVEAILVAVGKKNIKKAYLTTTMSPSVRLEV